jgi:hypothetical protein
VPDIEVIVRGKGPVAPEIVAEALTERQKTCQAYVDPRAFGEEGIPPEGTRIQIRYLILEDPVYYNQSTMLKTFGNVRISKAHAIPTRESAKPSTDSSTGLFYPTGDPVADSGLVRAHKEFLAASYGR